MGDLLDAAALPALFEGQVLWVPEFLIDEVSPEPRAQPDDWIIGRKLFTETVIVGEDAVGEEEEATRSFLPGDLVEFCSFQNFGTVEVTIAADGSFEAHGPVHPRVTHFFVDRDTDTLAMSLDEFARNWAANVGLAEPERLTVEHYTWSAPRSFVLAQCSDGPRFLNAGLDATIRAGAGYPGPDTADAAARPGAA